MLSFFQRGVLDEILNLIESVSEGFSSYSSKGKSRKENPQKLTQLSSRSHPRHVMIGMLSLHLMQSEIIIHGLVRKCVKLSPFS